MQGLTSYGSDSDEESALAGPSTTRTREIPVALPSIQQDNTKPIDHHAVASNRPTINRLKATSRAHSPLSGVRLPPSNNNSATASPNTSVAQSPNSRGKIRESSASPPPYAAVLKGSGAVTEGAEAGQIWDGADANGNNGSGGSQASSSRPVGVHLDSLAEFGIPAMATGPCNPSVEAKLANFHHLSVTRGLYFNDSLSASKAFRNPRIYTKLVEFVKVDETGSCWDKNVWDPHSLGWEATASRIAALQSAQSEAKASQPAGSRSSIAFSSSSSASVPNAYAPPPSRGDEQARMRDSMARKSTSSTGDKGRERDRDRHRDGGNGREKKSRWDTGAGGGRRDESRSPRRR